MDSLKMHRTFSSRQNSLSTVASTCGDYEYYYEYAKDTMVEMLVEVFEELSFSMHHDEFITDVMSDVEKRLRQEIKKITDME